MNTHSFDVEDAKRHGVIAATILQCLRRELSIAKGVDLFCRHGEYWIPGTIKDFARRLPYLTEKQIRTAFEKLEQSGAIESGIFNAHKFDRRKWYRIVDSDGVAE